MPGLTTEGIFSEPTLDGSPLRIAIIVARRSRRITEGLLQGAISKLKAVGVKENNIVIQSVPGSYELPMAVSKVITSSRVQAATTATDLLGGLAFASPAPTTVTTVPFKPFDAVIAIGALDGSEVAFLDISNTISQGLMRVQLDTGVPVVFGVLNYNLVNKYPAFWRNAPGEGTHGGDWGLAAVEMATNSRKWSEGKFQ